MNLAALSRTRSQPLVLVAIGAVALLGVAGVAAVAGFFPTADSRREESAGGRPEAPPERALGEINPSPAVACESCGIVEAIRTVEVRTEQVDTREAGERPKGAGAVVIAILGGGRKPEGADPKRVSYRVTTRMDDGSYRTLSQPTPPTVSVGDRIRVVEGAVVAR